MNDELLATYLNDHLAGAVTAIEQIEHLRSNADPPPASFLAELLAEVEQDRAVLGQVIEAVGAKESAARKATAWVSEKAGRLKFTGSGRDDVAFNRLEQLDAVLAGIRSKLGLWDVLGVLSKSDLRLAGFDWAGLKRRAEDQIRRLDERRIGAARQAFLTAQPG